MNRKAAVWMFCTALLSACQPQGSTAQAPSNISEPASHISEARRAAAETERVAAAADCRKTQDRRLADYKKLMAAKEYWGAAGQLRRCAQLLDVPNLRELVAAAEVKSYTSDLNSNKNSPDDRLRAFEMLERDYPEAAKPFAARHQKLRSEAAAKREEDRYATRFTRTPSIGATSRDVIANAWGYPSSINKTTSASGVREQWVYGDGHYLYFENGVLTAIQE